MVITNILLIALASIAAFSLLAWILLRKRTLPNYEGSIPVSGIREGVEIIRDRFGMPHIHAQNEADAYFALGYCCAQDRLFQMDLLRRAVRGRLAEVLGQEAVEIDRLFRTLTAPKPVDDILREQPPHIVSILSSYAAGVNRFLEERILPIEFHLLGHKPEAWDASDSLGAHYFMAWALNVSFRVEALHAVIADKVGEELARDLFVDYPADAPSIIHDATRASVGLLEVIEHGKKILGISGYGASNSWVIAGRKTKSGLPLLANDPHLELSIPGTWYEAHIQTPDLNVSGLTVPGNPFVVSGANGHAAWGVTSVEGDDSDYYIEKVNSDNPNQVEFMGKWEEMRVVRDTIRVKGGGEVAFEARLTRHGPLVDDLVKPFLRSANPLSMRWIATEHYQGMSALHLINHAKGIEDIEAAMEYAKCPSLSWVYADKKGNIGFWTGMAIPVRKGFKGDLPLPGWDGKHEWDGYIPTQSQPHFRNPEEGWIATANNLPAGREYPYVISNYFDVPDRIIRMGRMLEEKEIYGVEDCARMQADTYVTLAEELVPAIVKAVEAEAVSGAAAEALRLLREWDYHANENSAAASVYFATLNQMVERMFKKRLGNDLYGELASFHYPLMNGVVTLLRKGTSPWFNAPDVPGAGRLDNLLKDCFIAAVEGLASQFGRQPKTWTWGRIHKVRFYHPFGRDSCLLGLFFNVGPFPAEGGYATLNPTPYKFTSPWESDFGSSARLILDLGAMQNSRMITPPGASGNRLSPHYRDQVNPWRRLEYRPFLFERPAVEAGKRYRLLMTPTPKTM